MFERTRELTVMFKDGNAFVDIGNGYCLCIGREDEARQADATKITEMVNYAIAYSRYMSIGSARGNSVN